MLGTFFSAYGEDLSALCLREYSIHITASSGNRIKLSCTETPLINHLSPSLPRPAPQQAMETDLARYLVRLHGQQQDLPLDLASLHRKLRRYADGDQPPDDDYPALINLATPEDLLPAVWKLVEHQGLDVDTLALGSKTLVMLTRVHPAALEKRALLRSEGPAGGTAQSSAGGYTTPQPTVRPLSTTTALSPPSSTSSSPRVASIASPTAFATARTRSHDIAALLEKPTALEASAVAYFKKDAPSVREFCSHGTRQECDRQTRAVIAAAVAGAPTAAAASTTACSKLHFRRVIESHTDVSLGDCAYLSGCRRMRTCKYIHYEIEEENGHGNGCDRHGSAAAAAATQKRARSPALPHTGSEGTPGTSMVSTALPATPRAPAQWVNVDVRNFDLSVLGQFPVIMADPPWEVSKLGLELKQRASKKGSATNGIALTPVCVLTHVPIHPSHQTKTNRFIWTYRTAPCPTTKCASSISPNCKRRKAGSSSCGLQAGPWSARGRFSSIGVIGSWRKLSGSRPTSSRRSSARVARAIG